MEGTDVITFELPCNLDLDTFRCKSQLCSGTTVDRPLQAIQQAILQCTSRARFVITSNFFNYCIYRVVSFSLDVHEYVTTIYMSLVVFRANIFIILNLNMANIFPD
jgi:hypothetical protein